MQFSTIFVTLAAAATMASALPNLPSPPTYSAGNCATGNVQCCDDYKSGSDANGFLGLIGIQEAFDNIGLNCIQVPVQAGAVQNQCKSAPTCCAGSVQNGLIPVNCFPLVAN
ncbi:hydrophobin 2 [Violaceomyces palustris]|uniref:Hydrophobin 2 n=1 Tax=Violaceomyces palustris TaxID=1673888 RepID=A0ACD0NR08_9BASI|nr:hydrophobin 2 [Violaceomyces palustris]